MHKHNSLSEALISKNLNLEKKIRCVRVCGVLVCALRVVGDMTGCQRFQATCLL